MTRLSINPDAGDRGRRDEIRLREVDRSGRRAADAAAEYNTVVRHSWQGSRDIASGDTTYPLTNPVDWSVLFDGGIAAMVLDAEAPSGLVLGRAGRWSVTLVVESTATFASNSIARMVHPSLIDGRGVLPDSRPRLTGFGSSGYAAHSMTWSGYVPPAEATTPLVVQLRNAAAVTTAVTYSYWLQAQFLGTGIESAPVVVPDAFVPPEETPPDYSSG